MRNIVAAASAVAVAGGFAVLSQTPTVDAYVLPQSVGDEWFAEKAAKEALKAQNQHAAVPAAKRDESQPIRMNLVHSRREELNTPEKVKEFALRQKSYVERKFGRYDKQRRQTIGLTGVGPDT